MSFFRPLILWALVLLLPYAWLRLRRGRPAMAYGPAQLARGERWREICAALLAPLEILLLAGLVVALAGPHRTDELETLTEDGLDLALVLDISASMQAADFPPNRLEALKVLAGDFLRRASGNRLAVYAFAGHTFTQTPLTSEHSTLLELIDDLAFESIRHNESGGTAIGDALLTAADALDRARVEGRDQVIVLLTDGENNQGAAPELAARFVRDRDIRLYMIGLGGPQPVEVYVRGKPFINVNDEVLVTSLDDTQLQEIARLADGRYYRAETVDVLAAIFDELARLETRPLEVETYRLRRTQVPPFALGLFALFFLWLGIDGLAVRRPLR